MIVLKPISYLKVLRPLPYSTTPPVAGTVSGGWVVTDFIYECFEIDFEKEYLSGEVDDMTTAP